MSRALPLVLLCALALSACASAPPRERGASERRGPYVLVLGTAQDGGLPQLGCARPCCEAARAEPARRRLVTSLLVVDPRSGGRWLLDASPDLREQVERARGHGRVDSASGGRPALFDGIFLTHAHLGHYTGLLQLGREAYGSARVPVYGSRRMAAFLASNGPWELLVRGGHVDLRALAPGDELQLAEGLSLRALRVPHRDEYTDTLAFVVRGPERALLYLPDIDGWDRWERPIEDVLAEVDVALLDGTFFSADELPGRSIADIPHPLIASSLERFAALPAAARAKVRFTHLNHSNPAADPSSDAAARVRAAGCAVLREGEIVPLGDG